MATNYTYPERIKQGLTAAPGTSGNFALGMAVAKYKALAAAQDGATFEAVTISEGGNWEVRTGCVYDHDTLTLTRGTLADSSAGSAVSFTASAKISIGPSGVSAAAWQARLNALEGTQNLFYANKASFPATGSVDHIYVAKDNGLAWLWNGTAYQSIGWNAAGTAPVGPDGNVLHLAENKFKTSRGITLAPCTTASGCTLVGAGVTAQTVAVDVPGYKIGNSIRFTVPVGVTGSIAFPAFTARNIKNGVFGIVFNQESLDVGRAGAIYFGDTSTFTTNAYRADPVMNRFGLQCWSFANSATYGINEMAINAGTPTPQTVTNAKLLVNNTAGSVPWVATIHEVFGAAANRPTVSFCFDDGQESDFYEGMPILNNYGFLATFAIIGDLIGDSGYMTEDMLDRLYAEGHELAPHGQFSLATFGSVALALADIDANCEYLLGRGYSQGSDYYVYPGGVVDYSSTDRTSIYNHLVSRGMRAAYLYGTTSGGASYGVLQIRGAMRYTLPRLPVKATSVAATILNQIDALVSTGRSVVLNLHQIVASGATGDATNRAVFEDICSGLFSRQESGTLDVVPLSVAHNRVGL